LRQRFPYLAPELAGGSFCASDGQANPRLVAPAFARAARALGAEIREGAEVAGAVRDGAGFVVTLASGAELRGRTLINVAGAWGAKVAGWFGEDVPEEVMAPNMCVTEPVPFFLEPNLGVCGGNVYVRQTRQGSVVFGGGRGVADRDRVRARPL